MMELTEEQRGILRVFASAPKDVGFQTNALGFRAEILPLVQAGYVIGDGHGNYVISEAGRRAVSQEGD